MFPVFGFGARVPPKEEVTNMFPCNFDAANPSVENVEGIVNSYLGALRKIQLDGPTQFAPIICQTAAMAKKSMERNEYLVLLIITDGERTEKYIYIYM